MASVLEELSGALSAVVERVGPAVVAVGRAGSGLVTADGLVVTSAHNLRGGEVTVVFGDGRQAAARPLGVDAEGDVAVLGVDTGGIPAPAFAAGPAVPGQVVVGLARPAGGGVRAGLGVVSAVDVDFRGPGGRIVRGALEHSAPMARGASGGPVVDAAGRVAGIDTHRVGDGFYLAIPADDALGRRLAALAAGDVPHRPRLGVALAPSHVARRLRRSVGLPERPGLLVRAVEESGAAAAAGVEAGDLIVRVGDDEVATLDELADALAAAGAGAVVAIGLVRGADERTVRVTIPA